MKLAHPGRAASFAKGRLKRGEMNATEVRYAAHLADRERTGEVAWHRFEGVKLRLADGVFYTPDFFVMLADGSLEAHEVKGKWEDDARVKIKVAQSLYPFRFVAVRAVPLSRGGGWQAEDFERAGQPLLTGLRLEADVPPPAKRPKPDALPPRRKRKPSGDPARTEVVIEALPLSS